MADVTRRIKKWDAKFDTERVKATLDSLRPEMKKNYDAAMARMYPYELKTKEVLNQSGVHTSNYVPYLNYFRQLYKLSREQHITGESFAMAADVLKKKWVQRDLRPDVLDLIRTQVFDVGEPTAP